MYTNMDRLGVACLLQARRSLQGGLRVEIDGQTGGLRSEKRTTNHVAFLHLLFSILRWLIHATHTAPQHTIHPQD